MVPVPVPGTVSISIPYPQHLKKKKKSAIIFEKKIVTEWQFIRNIYRKYGICKIQNFFGMDIVPVRYRTTYTGTVPNGKFNFF